jgi:FAD:protein FMN transferase
MRAADLAGQKLATAQAEEGAFAMTMPSMTRRSALSLALAGVAGFGAGSAGASRRPPRLFRRLAIAFGTTVSITLEAADAATAETAFAAGFAQIRHIDRLASLTRPDGEVYRLNRDGYLDHPDPAIIDMLRIAREMHFATNGAFDVTIQPLWLAFDAAARRGSWPDEAEIADISQRVDQQAISFRESRIEFARPGMAITLNSLARGLAADRVAEALKRAGVVNALFDTDVLGSLGQRPDGAIWRAIVRHPRDANETVGSAILRGCLATSGDYQYYWSADYARNHIIDPRRGKSPGDFSSVSVLAESGLVADALSTAAFLVGAGQAPALVGKFGAEALFVDKAGVVTKTRGMAVL